MIPKTQDKIVIVDHSYCSTVILADYNYWGPRQEQLDAWLKRFGLVRQGMLIVFRDLEELAYFRLYWE